MSTCESAIQLSTFHRFYRFGDNQVCVINTPQALILFVLCTMDFIWSFGASIFEAAASTKLWKSVWPITAKSAKCDQRVIIGTDLYRCQPIRAKLDKCNQRVIISRAHDEEEDGDRKIHFNPTQEQRKSARAEQ